MKKTYAFLVSILVAGGAIAQTNWSLDKSHSKLAFAISHMTISEVEGGFKSFDAKITASKEDFSDGVVELTAEIASITTDNEGRDKHLQSPDYFDAAKYTQLTFKSKSFTKVGDKKYKVEGDLTMHGITKTVVLDVVLNGTVEHPYSKKTVAGFKVTGTLKRTDFGIATGTPAAMLGDEITIHANTEFVKG